MDSWCPSKSTIPMFRGSNGSVVLTALRQRGQLLLILNHGSKHVRCSWCPQGKQEMSPRVVMGVRQIPHEFALIAGICCACKYSSNDNCPGLIAWQRPQCNRENPHIWLCSLATHGCPFVPMQRISAPVNAENLRFLEADPFCSSPRGLFLTELSIAMFVVSV